MGLGLGGTDTPEVKLRKSISNERTFSATGDETLLFRKLGKLLLLLLFSFAFGHGGIFYHISNGIALFLSIGCSHMIHYHDFHSL